MQRQVYFKGKKKKTEHAVLPLTLQNTLRLKNSFQSREKGRKQLKGLHTK